MLFAIKFSSLIKYASSEKFMAHFMSWKEEAVVASLAPKIRNVYPLPRTRAETAVKNCKLITYGNC